MTLRPAGRLGLKELVKDHTATLYEIEEGGRRRRSVSDIVIFYIAPVALTVGLLVGRVWFKAVSDMLAGVSILTGLLFGLLIHVFSIGLKISEDHRWTATSKVTILVDELRSNVSYACAVGLALTALLVVAAVTNNGGPSDPGINPWLSAPIAGVFLHLVLTLLMVLKRVRTAYKLLAS